MKITQKYLFALLLAAFAAPMVAEEQDEDVVRAAPTVTLNLLKDYVANVTGKGYNAASMNNVAIYEVNKALASLVTSSTFGNVTLGVIASTFAYVPQGAALIASGDIEWASPTVNPLGIVSVSTTTITFTTPGTYLVIAQGQIQSTGGGSITITKKGSSSAATTLPDSTVLPTVLLTANQSVGFSFSQIVTTTAANQTLIYTSTEAGTDATLASTNLFITRLS